MRTTDVNPSGAIGNAAAALACERSLTVFVPDAFRDAFDRMSVAYLAKASVRIELVGGPAAGKAQEAVNNRMASGQHFDVALLPRALMEEHAQAGRLSEQGPVDLLRSLIGMCVAPGMPIPSVADEAALRTTLLDAISIALSTAGSGEYVAGRLLERLGIADQVRPKCIRVNRPSIGEYVTQGQAPIGFQQVSELLQVEGVCFGGLLPDGVQQATLISAGIGAGCRQPLAAKQYLSFLQSDTAQEILRSSGLEPVTQGSVDSIRGNDTGLGQG